MGPGPGDDISVRLYPCGAFTRPLAPGGDGEELPGIDVGPAQLRPLPGIAGVRRDEVEVLGIDANPNVALNFDATDSGENVVVIQGAAEIVETGPTAAQVPAYIEKYAGGLESLSMTPESFAGSFSVLIRVVPKRLRGF